VKIISMITLDAPRVLHVFMLSHLAGAPARVDRPPPA